MPRLRLSYERALFAAGAVCFVAWSILILVPVALPGRGADFRIFYTAASLPLQDLYRLDRQVAFQEQLWKQYGRFVPSPFPRPSFYAFLLKPLAWFDYAQALHIWLALLIAALVACILLLRALYGAGFGAFFLLVGYYPVSVALRNGQDSALVLLALLASLWSIRKDRTWCAALCLAYAFQKFNAVFLVPAALIVHRRMALWFRLCACLGVLAVWSALLVGRAGLHGYWLMLTNGSLDALFYDAWNIRAFIFRLGWNRTLYVAVTAVVAGWFLWLCRRVDFETAFCLAAGFSPLVSWHSYCYDYTIGLPFVYLLWVKYRVGSAIPLLAGGLWVHFFLMERVSWLITAAVLAASLELWWRSRPAPGPQAKDPAPAFALSRTPKD